MKCEAFWNKIKYETAIFAVLTAQAAFSLFRSGGIPANFLTFYLLDYKFGFISRAFIGAVIGLLTHRVTEKWLTGFILLTFLLVYLLLALMLGAMLRRVPAEIKPAVVCLLALFLFANFSIKVFIHNIGLPDIFLYLFVLLSAICLQNKYARWLVPVLCFFGISAHYGFVMIFFPVVFVLLCYEITRGKSTMAGIVLAAGGTAAALASAVYFVLFSNNFIKAGSETFLTYLQSKADFPVWRFFVEGILFYTDINTGEKVEGFSGFMGVLKQTAAEGLRMSGFAQNIILLAPLFLLFFFIWKGAAESSGRKAEKTVFLLCMALPLPLLPWFIFSTDTPRLLGEIFVVQFTALFYMIYSRNAAVTESLVKTGQFFKKYPLVFLLLFAFGLSAVYFK